MSSANSEPTWQWLFSLIPPTIIHYNLSLVNSVNTWCEQQLSVCALSVIRSYLLLFILDVNSIYHYLYSMWRPSCFLHFTWEQSLFSERNHKVKHQFSKPVQIRFMLEIHPSVCPRCLIAVSTFK